MIRFVLAGLGIFLGLFFLLSSTSPVTFESMESKTLKGDPVFNQIKFIFGWQKDIWLMRQTHHGYNTELSEWDRLAIIVDKTKTPHEATFYQLQSSSDLVFEGKPIPYKARCFACHANGPRAIRWNADSPEIKPNLWDRAQIALWNLRIKTYGHVNSHAGAQFDRGTPFKSNLSVFSRPLGLVTCQKCHANGGIRNELTLEHVGTARFLVMNGFMPPFPFQATDEEVRILEKYAGAE